MGVGVALPPLIRLVPMLENSRDGEGSSGEEFVFTAVAWGGVTVMGEQEGEEESTMLAIAMLAERRLRWKEMERVRTEGPSLSRFCV